MATLTLNQQLDKVFKQAASGALIEWGLEGEKNDLVQDLWVWYLESPSTQRKMSDLSQPEQITTVKIRAHQLISKKVLGGNVTTGKVIYSVDSVKTALKGESTNKSLPDLLILGMLELQQKDDRVDDLGKPRGYAEAIRKRYEDNDVPVEADADRLSKALTALTDAINVLYLTSDDRGRHAMFPDLRKPNGRYSDPTGEMACSLIEKPEHREEFYYQLDIDSFLKGADVQPVRWDVQRNASVRVLPGAVVPGAVSTLEADADS